MRIGEFLPTWAEVRHVWVLHVEYHYCKRCVPQVGMRAEAETANEGKAKKRLDMVRWIAAFQSMALAAAANKVLQ